MSDLRIYGYLVSTWTRTACMAAIEKGVSYELLPIARGSAEHQAMHPFAKMPVVEHEGRVITEALAITGYIDEAFPGPPLQTQDLESLRLMRTWMSVCSDYVFRDVVRGIPRGRAPSDEQLAAATAVLEKLDAMIGEGRRFLVGDGVTLADLYLAPQASNAREKAPELFAGFPRLSAWLGGIETRPSFAATAYDPAAL
jgi:glutathione S-transferase